MKLWDREKSAEVWYTIKSNKRRSVFTSMGVFFGMFFFTVMLSVGIGMENALTQVLSSISSDLHFFWATETTKPYQGYPAKRKIDITYSDFLKLAQAPQHFSHLAAMRYWRGEGGSDWRQTISANGKTHSFMAVGVTEKFYSIMGVKVVAGRMMREDEIATAAPVCLLGRNRVGSFFDTPEEAVGQTLSISGVAFKIIGVIDQKGAAGVGASPGWNIFIPMRYTVANNPEADIFIYALPKPGATDEQLKEEVLRSIQNKYYIDPTDDKVVNSMSVRLFYDLFGMVAKGINILVWLIGMGTLFTGVISVSNILLVTVRERQREIGVRRALGAKPSNIFEQFISESILIISLAGFGGMISGLSIVLLLGAVSESNERIQAFLLSPYPSVNLLILAASIILIAGVVAGLLPVYKALQVKAIDAIRDE